MAIKDDIAALQDATAAQDSVIGSLKTFIAGIPALIDAAVAAQEAGDESALQDLKTHIAANTDAISQAVVSGTSAAAPESGVNDDPVVAAAARANAADASDDNASTTATAGNVDNLPAGEVPVPAERVEVDADHQPATPNPDDAPLTPPANGDNVS